MTAILAIGVVGADPVAAAAASMQTAAPPAQPAKPAEADFGSLLGQGLNHVENKLTEADRLVRAFALDESVPIHQVTIALEEARIAVELAMQVRTHLVEAYREIMNTQL